MKIQSISYYSPSFTSSRKKFDVQGHIGSMHDGLHNCNSYYNVQNIIDTVEPHNVKKVLVSLGLKAAQPGLNQPDVKSIKLLLPDEETIDNFNAFTEPLVDQLFIAANKNKRLSCQRDFLLPLLMNGQVIVQ